MAKEINILNFKCSSLNLLLMNIVEVNMSTENEYQEKKEVESYQVFIINTQDCIIVWWALDIHCKNPKHWAMIIKEMDRWRVDIWVDGCMDG